MCVRICVRLCVYVLVSVYVAVSDSVSVSVSLWVCVCLYGSVSGDYRGHCYPCIARKSSSGDAGCFLAATKPLSPRLRAFSAR